MGCLSAMGGSIGGLLGGGPVGAIMGGIGGLIGGGGGSNLALTCAGLTSAIAQNEKNLRGGTGSPQQLNSLLTAYHGLQGLGGAQQQQMLADMQHQNQQNFLFQQKVNQQTQQFTTLSNAQKAMHDAIMAMLRNVK